MIDLFTLALTHGLIALAAIRLLSRDDLDDDTAPAVRPRRKRFWSQSGEGSSDD